MTHSSSTSSTSSSPSSSGGSSSARAFTNLSRAVCCFCNLCFALTPASLPKIASIFIFDCVFPISSDLVVISVSKASFSFSILFASASASFSSSLSPSSSFLLASSTDFKPSLSIPAALFFISSISLLICLL